MAAVGAIAAIAATGILVFAGDGRRTAEEAMRARLADVTDPAVFAFAYSGAGTRVTDCFLPNRRFVANVDVRAGLAVFARTAAGPTPLAVVTKGGAVLHQSLFEEGAVATPWLRVAIPTTPAVEKALRRALGVDLAAYVVRPGAMATAAETARAAVDAALDVRRVGPEAKGTGRERYRVRVDPERPEKATTSLAADAATPAPVIDVWFEDRTIARISVLPERPAGQTGEVEAVGWTLDYSIPERPPSDRVAGAVTDLGDVDPASLTAPGGRSCALPL